MTAAYEEATSKLSELDEHIQKLAEELDTVRSIRTDCRKRLNQAIEGDDDAYEELIQEMNDAMGNDDEH